MHIGLQKLVICLFSIIYGLEESQNFFDQRRSRSWGKKAFKAQF